MPNVFWENTTYWPFCTPMSISLFVVGYPLLALWNQDSGRTSISGHLICLWHCTHRITRVFSSQGKTGIALGDQPKKCQSSHRTSIRTKDSSLSLHHETARTTPCQPIAPYQLQLSFPPQRPLIFQAWDIVLSEPCECAPLPGHLWWRWCPLLPVLCCLQIWVPDSAEQEADEEASACLWPALGCSVPTSASLSPYVVQNPEVKPFHLMHMSSHACRSDTSLKDLSSDRCLPPRICRHVTLLSTSELPLHLTYILDIYGQTGAF